MGDNTPIRVESWPAERPLRMAVIAVSAAVWFLLAASITGVVYALAIGAIVIVARLASAAGLRGSGLRLGTGQMPGLFSRVEELCRRAGLAEMPEVYVVNDRARFAARIAAYPGWRALCIPAALLQAGAADPAVLDMIVGREIGRLRCGHLDFRWLLLPASIIPFLGGAYSRACEFTCDRWGAALCRDPETVLKALALDATGGAPGAPVDMNALAGQRRSLNTGLMTIGRWLGRMPPLCMRVAALRPDLAPRRASLRRGTVSALAMILASFALCVVCGSMFWNTIRTFIDPRTVTVTATTRALRLFQKHQDSLLMHSLDSLEAADEMQLHKITAASKTAADEALRRLRKGESFADVAMALSTDEYKIDGGYMGRFAAVDLSHEFQGRLAAVKRGEFTAPFPYNGKWVILLKD